jgi:hypothetical protein
VGWIVAALVVALAWVPVVYSFLCNFRNRRNPISVVIAIHAGLSSLVVLLIASCISDFADERVVAGVALSSSLATAALYQWAFWWAGRKFPESRE